MSKIDNGGPAFPRPVSEDRTNGDLPDGYRVPSEQDGMTLRDYFAAKAMQAMLHSTRRTKREIINQAWDAADQMIAARKK